MFILPDLRPQDDYLYKRMGPWPQPQPSHPFGFAPGVVHVPKPEKKTWFRHVGLRYMMNVLTYWPKALIYSFKNPGLKPLSDEEFEKLLTHSSLSKFVSNELNERDKYPLNQKLNFFKEFLEAEPDEKFYVSDFSLIRQVNPDPGNYVAPTMVLFKGELVDEKRKVVAIYFPELMDKGDLVELMDDDGLQKLIDDGDLQKLIDKGNLKKLIDVDNLQKLIDKGNLKKLIDKGNLRELIDLGDLKRFKPNGGHMFTPADGDAWELAKYFAMNGASMRISLSAHANLHFPYDCINAISKSSLPKDSVLLRLLMPHFSLTLALNYAVLNTSTSPLQNPKHMPFAALPCGGDNLAGMFIDGFHGIAGNPSYPPFEYKLEVEKMYSDYGTFLDDYYKTVFKFVDEVVLRIPPEEYIYIKIWANYINSWLPHFPSGDEIFKGIGNNQLLLEGQVLSGAIAKVIWDLSIGHSADHYDYSLIDINVMPFMIHIPPPTTKNHPPLDRRTITLRKDIYHHEMERKLFFKPKTVYALKDVVYDFKKDEKDLKVLGKQFIKDLRETENKLTVHNYIPLDKIASSIQY